jgi:hypothetical protein
MTKSNILKAATAIAILFFSLTGFAQKVIISSSELPVEIATYTATHFPSNTILQVILDKEGSKKTYDVTLSEGFNLEFNRNMEIIEIEGISQLPESVIPEKIWQYVKANFPNNVITEWELDGRKQEIELDNGLELDFNMNGDFLKIDN